ncbi:MAG TPA: undecaprenyl-diphosphate phosphatase, partial [Trueperaceae bacterium]
AVIPGISRSGSTIAALLARGADKELAPRMSFLLYLVVSAGVALLGVDEVRTSGVEAVPLAVMTASSFAVGYLALRLVFAVLRRGRFRAFSPYLWAVSALTLAWLLFT